MKRFFLWLVGVCAVLLGAFLAFAPAYVDDQFNSPLPYDPYPVSAEAKRVYSGLEGIADLHSDPLLWQRDLGTLNTRGHVDIPRLVAGNMALQVFGAVTKTPRGQNYDRNTADTDNITLLAMAQLWPTRTWFSLEQRALYQAEKLNRFARSSNGALEFVRWREDLLHVLAAREAGEDVTAGFIGLEGAHALEGDIAALGRLFDAGYRMIGLAHFFDNEVAGSVHGVEKYGLTALGKDVVAKAQARGMIIDVAHASHAAIADVLALTTAPVVFSHGGVKGTCNTNRNLTDQEVTAIANTGGLIGLGAWDAAACGAAPADLARAMAYVKNLVGAEHIAIGSDFDGAIKSAYTLSDYDALVSELLERGFTRQEIEGVMLGNALRVFLHTLPNKPSAP